MSKKRAIILLFTAIFVGFLMVQPFNYMCRATDFCNPIILSYYFPKAKGKNSYEVFFMAKNYSKELKFEAVKASQIVVAGGDAEIIYNVKNISDRNLEIRPKPYIEPKEAAKYIKFYECLCFRAHKIKAGKSLNLKVRFNIDKKIEQDNFFNENSSNIILGYEIN